MNKRKRKCHRANFPHLQICLICHVSVHPRAGLVGHPLQQHRQTEHSGQESQEALHGVDMILSPPANEEPPTEDNTVAEREHNEEWCELLEQCTVLMELVLHGRQEQRLGHVRRGIRRVGGVVRETAQAIRVLRRYCGNELWFRVD